MHVGQLELSTCEPFSPNYPSSMLYSALKRLFCRFATERTTFIHLDLSRSPALAKELKINIDGYAGEIPTFIVFQKVENTYNVYTVL